MEIQNNLDSLNSLLGLNATDAATGPAKSQGTQEALSTSEPGADQATLSSAASEMAQAVGDDGVRTGKVAEIQAALANGTYAVPASAVASKMVDAMLGGQ